MKLAFNGINSGLGNNGGSRTIIKCCEVLNELGHRCDIIANVDNFTWFNHKPIINYISKDLDAIINIASIDYNTTRRFSVPIKAAWWRGHEIWNNTEDHLRYCYTDKSVRNFVNSKGLQKLLQSYGAESEVIYQGLDLDDWKYVGGRPYDKIRIGCLYQKKPTKKWEDFIKLAEILGHKNYEYVGFGDTIREDSFLDKFICLPTHEELMKLYSSCHIWFCPSILEGLSNVPMEAALCSCLIVCSDSPLGGMIHDYAFDDTAMIYEADNIEHAAKQIQNAKWENTANMYGYLTNFIGSREKNMKKMVKYLENL